VLPAQLQAHIAKHLPKAMVPHQVVHLKEFPRNDANNIDRKALIPPALDVANFMQEGFAVIDSLGSQRFLASRDDIWAHNVTEAMYA